MKDSGQEDDAGRLGLLVGVPVFVFALGMLAVEVGRRQGWRKGLLLGGLVLLMMAVTFMFPL